MNGVSLFDSMTWQPRRARARVACAASLLRWIYSMVIHGTSWDAAVASGVPACQPEAA